MDGLPIGVGAQKCFKSSRGKRCYEKIKALFRHIKEGSDPVFPKSTSSLIGAEVN